MKRRILLVDDEVAVLLTLKAVLEISGFDVDTATSAREGKSRIRHREYEMVITDMRMEEEEAGREVIEAAREAVYSPAIALLTAHPIDDEMLSSIGADKMLVKPMHTRVLLQQLESLFVRHVSTKEKATAAPVKSAAKKSAAVVKKPIVVAGNPAVKKAKKATVSIAASAKPKKATAKKATAKTPAKKAPAANKVSTAAKKSAAKKALAKKPGAAKSASKKAPAKTPKKTTRR